MQLEEEVRGISIKEEAESGDTWSPKTKSTAKGESDAQMLITFLLFMCTGALKPWPTL